MTNTDDPTLYQRVWRDLIKSEIHHLLQRLWTEGGEECFIVTASSCDDQPCLMGSEKGLAYMEDFQGIIKGFLSFIQKEGPTKATPVKMFTPQLLQTATTPNKVSQRLDQSPASLTSPALLSQDENCHIAVASLPLKDPSPIDNVCLTRGQSPISDRTKLSASPSHPKTMHDKAHLVALLGNLDTGGQLPTTEKSQVQSPTHTPTTISQSNNANTTETLMSEIGIDNDISSLSVQKTLNRSKSIENIDEMDSDEMDDVESDNESFGEISLPDLDTVVSGTSNGNINAGHEIERHLEKNDTGLNDGQTSGKTEAKITETHINPIKTGIIAAKEKLKDLIKKSSDSSGKIVTDQSNRIDTGQLGIKLEKHNRQLLKQQDFSQETDGLKKKKNEDASNGQEDHGTEQADENSNGNKLKSNIKTQNVGHAISDNDVGGASNIPMSLEQPIAFPKYTYEQLNKKIKDKTCPVCHRKFYRLSAVRYHLVTHTSEKPFQCRVCNKAFRWDKGRRQHEKNKHTDRRVDKNKMEPGHLKYFTEESDSTDAGILFSGKKSLELEDISINEALKHKTTRNMTDTGENETGIISINKIQDYEKLLQTAVIPYTCSYPGCTKSYNSKGHLQDHVVMSHTKERTCKCVACDMDFIHRSHFYAHKKRMDKQGKGDRCCMIRLVNKRQEKPQMETLTKLQVGMLSTTTPQVVKKDKSENELATSHGLAETLNKQDANSDGIKTEYKGYDGDYTGEIGTRQYVPSGLDLDANYDDEECGGTLAVDFNDLYDDDDHHMISEKRKYTADAFGEVKRIKGDEADEDKK